jgi:hypothetical protein
LLFISKGKQWFVKKQKVAWICNGNIHRWSVCVEMDGCFCFSLQRSNIQYKKVLSVVCNKNAFTASYFIALRLTAHWIGINFIFHSFYFIFIHSLWHNVLYVALSFLSIYIKTKKRFMYYKETVNGWKNGIFNFFLYLKNWTFYELCK